MDDELAGICLERFVELPSVELRVRDWPGLLGPLVHVADAEPASDELIGGLAAKLAPRWRVLSVLARASELAAFLRVFGFVNAVLLGEGRGCLAAALVAAWRLAPVESLVLVNPRPDVPPGLDWDALLAALACPVETVDEFLRRAAG